MVRDYAGGIDSGNSKCTVADGPNGAKVVRSDFYNHYLATENGKVNHIALGAPLDEEHWTGTDVAQNFEGGRMLWNPTQGTRVQYLDQRPTPLPLADIVGEVYRRVLDRDRKPGEGAEWEAFAQARRTKGRSDSQLRNLLAAEFHNSAEFNS